MTTTTKIEFINQREGGAQYVASLSKDKFYELFPRPLESVKGSGDKELNNNEYYKLVIQYLAIHESKHFDDQPLSQAKIIMRFGLLLSSIH